MYNIAFPDKAEKLRAATSYSFKPEISNKLNDKYMVSYKQRLLKQIADLDITQQADKSPVSPNNLDEYLDNTR